jgi:tRNA(adenine34) deaminase
MDDEKFMKAALKEAEKAYKEGEVPVGAVLVHEGKIIARSHNQVESLQDATAHAEMLLLTMGASYFNNWRLLKTTLYCTLEPCLMCAGGMLLSRIERLVWGAKDIRHGACGSLMNVFSNPHPTHSLLIQGGVLESESARLMQEFFREKRAS